MVSAYDLDKIKFGTDIATFERAVNLYESGKVTKFSEDIGEYSAVVLGSSPYRVFISPTYYDRGDCECYVAQNDELCKHMVAVAICAVLGGKKLSANDKKVTATPTCSNKKGVLSKEKLKKTKSDITAALKFIKPYDGPSRTWFTYQNSLREGCARLGALVSDLPVSKETAKLLINLLLRLDKKLSDTGVDDSDGTVGNFMTDIAQVLVKFTEIEPAIKKEFVILKGKPTCFDWEKPLLDLLKDENSD